MSLYSEFQEDAREMIEDFGVQGSATGLTFLCLVSDPTLSQSLEPGGFVLQTQYSVRLPASDASWSLPDGSIGASGPIIQSGQIVPALRVGQKIVAAGLPVRVLNTTYKPGSAWVTLSVVHEDQ